MNNKLRKGIAALLCMVMATPVGAALRYTLVTDIVRENNKVEKDRLVERVTVDGDKGRIDFLAPDGSEPENGDYLVTRDGGKTFAWFSAGEAVCANWSTTDFFQTIGKLLQKGQRFINAEMHEATVAKTVEEPGPRMLGYPTVHLRLVTTFGAEGRFLFKKLEYAVEETDDVWMTTELELPALERQWVEAMAHTGFAYADAISARWDAEVTGTVLKQKNVVRITNLRSEEVSVKTETLEVTELERLEPAQIPAATFAMPRCKKVDKGDLKKEATRFIKKRYK